MENVAQQVLLLKAKQWDMVKIFMEEDEAGRIAMGGHNLEQWFKKHIAHYNKEMHRICED